MVETLLIIREIGTDVAEVPGFCIPRGLQPVLPLFLECLVSGSPEIKEQVRVGVERVKE